MKFKDYNWDDQVDIECECRVILKTFLIITIIALGLLLNLVR